MGCSPELMISREREDQAVVRDIDIGGTPTLLGKKKGKSGQLCVEPGEDLMSRNADMAA